MTRIDRLFINFTIIVLSIWFLSFRWPVNNGRITSTFGESRGDHFHDGIDMISVDKNVYPPSNGRLAYCWNKSLFPFDNYTGSGNFKIISHDLKLTSVYLHLEDSESLNDNYSENDKVGLFGDTGRSYGAHIHFTILDILRNESINPFSILPVLDDKKQPVIGPYALHIGEKYVLLKNNSKIHLTQNWPLLVNIYDQIKGGERLGIYKFNAVLNNELVLDITFNKITFLKNGLTINKKFFDTIYDSNGYYKISNLSYKSGINTIVLTAIDFSGNSKSETFSIDVTLDR
jgi:murein DD-endopeptidase MepM/ murein hydrolase activator NlpD